MTGGAAGTRWRPPVAALLAAFSKANGELVAVNQDTGELDWADPLPSSPYGGAAVTNDVVFTTIYAGYLYAVDAAAGTILRRRPLSAGTNAPVTIDGDYVIVGTSIIRSARQRPLIIAYKIGGPAGSPHRGPVTRDWRQT